MCLKHNYTHEQASAFDLDLFPDATTSDLNNKMPKSGAVGGSSNLPALNPLHSLYSSFLAQQQQFHNNIFQSQQQQQQQQNPMFAALLAQLQHQQQQENGGLDLTSALAFNSLMNGAGPAAVPFKPSLAFLNNANDKKTAFNKPASQNWVSLFAF
jgi:hypothetical protein